ncbi:FxsA family protein [Halobium palmae]|uniref:FxsA family protein n=1 Tax=Halobium palmae TaxID=1776492 RepID=A0ABD5S0W4_9EURY
MKSRYLIALLLLIPLADSLALVGLAAFVFPWTVMVALVVLTGLIGMLLVRAEGRHTMRKLERNLSAGEIPTDQLLDGGLLIAAGAFLLTPGIVTDALGFLLAVPVTRYPIREAVKRFVAKPYLDRKMDGFVSGNVWTGGFPQQETYDVDPNSYRFDREDESESG